MKKFIIAAGLGACLTQAAIAAPYGSVSYALFETEFEVSGGSVDFDTPTVQFALGNQFNQNFAAEIRLGLGADEDSSFGLDLEVSDYLALYLRPTLPLSDTVSLYALLGLAKTNIDSSVGDDDDNDFSYGFGFAAKTSSTINLFVEYISLYDESDSGVDIEISGFNLGVGFDF